MRRKLFAVVSTYTPTCGYLCSPSVLLLLLLLLLLLGLGVIFSRRGGVRVVGVLVGDGRGRGGCGGGGVVGAATAAAEARRLAEVAGVGTVIASPVGAA